MRLTPHQAYQRVETLTIPEAGQLLYLKVVGRGKVFCQRFKNESCRYYAVYLPVPEVLEASAVAEFEK